MIIAHHYIINAINLMDTKLLFSLKTILVLCVGWAYMRLYSNNFMKSKKMTGILCIFSILFSWITIIGILFLSKIIGKKLSYYHFVNNANKLFAILTAISLFLFFNNLNLGTNKILNTFAAISFGVLLLH